jgi:PIN domain nuclease of toxin-antitoxin system
LRVLLDTHVFLWWMTDDLRLNVQARELLRRPTTELLWSVASSWEVATKHALGRLPLPVPPAELLQHHRELNNIGILPIAESHVFESAALPRHHADPFDRLLIAQARLENLALMTFDRALDSYEFVRPW